MYDEVVVFVGSSLNYMTVLASVVKTGLNRSLSRPLEINAFGIDG